MVAGGLLAAVFVGGLTAPSIVRAVRVANQNQPMVAGANGAKTADDPSSIRREEARAPATEIIIGSKAFTEQYILQEVLARQLELFGIPVRRIDSLGSTVLFNGLTANEVDVYVEYTGTVWANHMKRESTEAPWNIMLQMSGWLADTYGIRSLGKLGFENAYALAMRREHAEKLGIRSIADLGKHAPRLKIGGDYEFFGRPEWTSIRDAYQLDFAEKITYDPTFMYSALAGGEVDVISAFSTDGRIAALDLVVLEEPKHVNPPYDAVILLSPEAAGRESVVAALEPLIGTIDANLMRRANYMVDRTENKRTVSEAAEWLLPQILR